MFGGEGGELGEVVAGDEGQSGRVVRIAEEEPGALGCELVVVVPADRGEVPELVGAAPAAGPEVMDLESEALVTAGPAAIPVALADDTLGLLAERGLDASDGDRFAVVTGENTENVINRFLDEEEAKENCTYLNGGEVAEKKLAAAEKKAEENLTLNQ